MAEWPLVIFTLLIQGAAGAFFLHEIPRRGGFMAPPAGPKNSLLPVIAALPLLAAPASFFHLSHPFRSLQVFRNIGSSWLSREILLFLLFLGMILLYTVGSFFSLLSPQLRKILFWITILAGGALIFAMAKLYMLPTMPLWETLVTPARFYLSAVTLGGIILLAGGARCRTPMPRRRLTGLVIAGLSTKILLLGFLYHRSFTPSPGHRHVLELFFQSHLFLLLLHLGLVFLAIFLLIYRLPSRRPSSGSSLLTEMAISAVVISEITGRFLFYLSGIRWGM